MSGSDTPAMEVLSSADIDAGIRLSGEAGWNQVPEDWSLYLKRGYSVGFRDGSGNVVGTAAAMPYERGYGYVALVLVTPDWRRRGFATRLVENCLDWLEERGSIPMLDATEAGAAGYRKQGFEPLMELDRWQASLPPPAAADADEEKPDAIELAELVGLDEQAFGAARAHLLDDIRRRDGSRTFLCGKGGGFAMIRRGKNASQIGPLVAPDERAAAELVAEVAGAAGGDVIIDVPKRWEAFGHALEAIGFSRRRSFLRMVRGKPPKPTGPALLFASAGPEYG